MRCGSAQYRSHVIADSSCGGGAYPSSRHLREANSYAAEQARRNPGRLYFLVYLNPQNPDWKQELERGVRNGAVGAKLWISLKNPHGGLEETVAVLRRAAELGLRFCYMCSTGPAAICRGSRHVEFGGSPATVPECVYRGHSGGNWRSVPMLKYVSECVTGRPAEQSDRGWWRNSANVRRNVCSTVPTRRAELSFLRYGKSWRALCHLPTVTWCCIGTP